MIQAQLGVPLRHFDLRPEREICAFDCPQLYKAPLLTYFPQNLYTQVFPPDPCPSPLASKVQHNTNKPLTQGSSCQMQAFSHIPYFHTPSHSCKSFPKEQRHFLSLKCVVAACLEEKLGPSWQLPSLLAPVSATPIPAVSQSVVRHVLEIFTMDNHS